MSKNKIFHLLPEKKAKTKRKKILLNPAINFPKLKAFPSEKNIFISILLDSVFASDSSASNPPQRVVISAQLLNP
jgi:hypothetical protein